jgi:hypothetical protein
VAIRLVATVVGLGGVVTMDGERLVCRKPPGVMLSEEVAAGIRMHKAAIMAALMVASFEDTVEHIRAMGDAKRLAYEQALIHDLLAYAVAIGEEER